MPPRKKTQVDYNKGITSITIGGFKSISEETTIEIRPLTILAGANSSGKSSMIQPLLMMKQTLEATYDTGPLFIKGPLVDFSSIDQFVSKGVEDKKIKIAFSISDIYKCSGEYKCTDGKIEIQKNSYNYIDDSIDLFPSMSVDYIEKKIPSDYKQHPDYSKDKINWSLKRERCFLAIYYSVETIYAGLYDSSLFNEYLTNIIHLPGLRGNPERVHNSAALDNGTPGPFEKYVASLIDRWKKNEDTRFNQLCQALMKLGIANKIDSTQLNDTQIEIKVGRTLKSTKNDLVSIADVGFGVSQVLPVLVALLAAEEGQLVHLEQPELHLHPHAQVAMAEILADAARRGVRVVVETHSDLLLLAIQTLVAENKFPKELVKLHWFERNPKTGVTKVTSSDMDEEGAYGDWPEDFGKITLEAENRYLSAAEEKQFRKTS